MILCTRRLHFFIIILGYAVSHRSRVIPSDMLVTFFYSAVICSIIMFESVYWGGNISKFGRRLEKIVKKSGYVVGMPLDSFKTL